MELERPATDQAGTQSNVRITVIDTNMAMPVERSRTVTTYNTDVRHDHKGKGNCTGKLIADDKRKGSPPPESNRKENGKTAGAVYDLVAQKIVANRPASQ